MTEKGSSEKTGSEPAPLVGIVMGSSSDYETMQKAEEILIEFRIPYEIQVVSAHRTPTLMYEYGKSAHHRGLKVLIAGAGGAAHLPGMLSALTVLPVLAVPVQSKSLNGLDSLLSIVQMPGGVPTATFAIGAGGALNAGLFAIQILAVSDLKLAQALIVYKEGLADKALSGNAIVQAKQIGS